MIIDINKIIQEFEAEAKTATNITKLIEIKNKFYKANISPLNSNIKNLPNEQKPEYGKELKTLNEEFNKKFSEINLSFEQEAEKQNHNVNYDISLETTNITKGALHPVTLMYKKMIEFFSKYDFTICQGEQVEKIAYNFDHLNIEEGHPTRETSETFYVNDPTVSMRSQMTAQSARFMHNNKDSEIRGLFPGWVYRNDEDDISHSHQFHQLDFIWIKEKTNFRNLKWLLNSMYKHIYGNDVKTKYMLSNYAFTEPSFEVAGTCPNCKGKGCKLCKMTGWVTLLGAGIFHENVMKASNIKYGPNGLSGIAGGIGIERCAIIKYGFSDVRDLYKNDFKIINQLRKMGGK